MSVTVKNEVRLSFVVNRGARHGEVPGLEGSHDAGDDHSRPHERPRRVSASLLLNAFFSKFAAIFADLHRIFSDFLENA